MITDEQVEEKIEEKLNERKSFLLYRNYLKYFKLMSYEDRGRLITALMEYADGVEGGTELDGMALMAFEIMRDNMDRDTEEYVTACRNNIINGRKGGRPKKTETASEKGGVISEEKNQNSKTHIDIDKDKDKETETDKDNDMEKGKDKDIYVPAAPPHAPLTEYARKKLISEGVSAVYIDRRLYRAEQYARENKREIADVLLEWWREDQKQSKRKPAFSLSSPASDADEWFRQKLEKQREASAPDG